MATKADVNLVRSLSSKGERASSGLFVAEGEKLVGEILASDWPVMRLFATEKAVREVCGCPAETVSAKEMERMSHLKTPTDILAVVELPTFRLPEITADDLTVVLDGVQDPGNLGTIIRLADWFGIGDIICSPDTADCFNPKVVQATMGAILRVRVHYTELEPLLQRADDDAVPVYGTFLDGDNIYESDLTRGGLIVMGSEGKGVSDAVAGLATRRLHIPPYPAGNASSESLNVAVAAAIACSEFRRRLSMPGADGRTGRIHVSTTI